MEVCTIIAKNYVAHARVLARTLTASNPQSRLWTLIIDDFERYIDPAQEPFEVLTPEDIGCDPFIHMALRYSVLELSTAVKPWLLRNLMERTGGPVTYLDPDIRVYAPLGRLDELAAAHGVALIPHNNQPLPPDGRKPSQIDIMIAGVYNLGYVSLAPGPEVEHLLDWWADRLRRDCRVDPIWGYFVDQRWFDLVPGFLTDFAIVREPEYNVAYWNLHSRRLERDGERYLVNGRPLAFFHFSGFDPAQPLSLSRHQDRVDVSADPVLERLLAEYAAEVMAEGHAVSRNWPYSYLALGDGTEIDDFVRALCDEFADEQEARQNPAQSPFTPAGARVFHDWLGADAPGRPPGINRVLAHVYEDRPDLRATFPDLAGSDRERLLRWARDIGPGEVPLLARVGAGRNGGPPESAAPVAMVEQTALPDAPWGVNLVGHFHSADELGQIARQLVAALDLAGVPVAPVSDWSIPSTSSEEPFATVAPDDAPFAVNLLCISPEALPELAVRLGDRFLRGRYTIALWLSDAAPPREHLSLLQEVWAPSHHVASALEGAATVPVHTVAVPVSPPVGAPLTRAELGLGDGFVFLSGFEYGPGFGRTNALGAARAFRRAFAPDDSAVLLLAHVGGSADPASRAALQAEVDGHPGIRILDGPLTRERLSALTAMCDCYVSLHRAQAFGLEMAEAMWWGKPVIATGYSGNMDYMDSEDSRLVGFERDGDLAAPDVQQAAQQMRELAGDPESARALGERAGAAIRASNSPAGAAQAIDRRLQSIRATGRAPRAVPAVHRRSTTLGQLHGAVRRGPVSTARAGRGRGIRDFFRRAVLRALRPYTSYQQRINSDLVTALDEVNSNVVEGIAELRAEGAAERAQLLAELRSTLALRAELEAQERRLEELRRGLADFRRGPAEPRRGPED